MVRHSRKAESQVSGNWGIGLIQHSLEGSPPRQAPCPKPGRGKEDSRQPLAAHTAQRDDGDRNTTHNTTVSCGPHLYFVLFFSSNTCQPYFLSINLGGGLEGTKSTFVLSTAVVECLLVSCKLGGVCIPHALSTQEPRPRHSSSDNVHGRRNSCPRSWSHLLETAKTQRHWVTARGHTGAKHAPGQLLLKHSIILIFSRVLIPQWFGLERLSHSNPTAMHKRVKLV